MPSGIYRRTPAMCANIAKAVTGHIVSKETRAKTSKTLTGIHRSEETNIKHSEALAGHIVLKETRKKISQTLTGRYVGKNNFNWKGGKSFEEYPIEFNDPYKETIRARDHYTCQLDSTHNNKGRTMCVHHIDYNKKNCNPTNLITLCRGCNCIVNANRNSWMMYFDNLLSITQPY